MENPPWFGKNLAFRWAGSPAHVGPGWKATVQHPCDPDLELDGVVERQRNVVAFDLKRKAAVSLQGGKLDDPVVRFGPHEGRLASVGT